MEIGLISLREGFQPWPSFPGESYYFIKELALVGYCVHRSDSDGCWLYCWS